MATEIDRITRLLEKTFDKQPWYGSSVMSVLKEIDPAQVHKRVGQAHTMIELVLHMTAWRTFALSRLSGDITYQVTDELNFPKPSTQPDAWSKALKSLEANQRDLLAAVAKFPDDKLGELVPGASHKYTWYTLLHGIIDHDVYHLGQIAILQRAVRPL
jgi:uncharacterized damage-inducible protein DinB